MLKTRLASTDAAERWRTAPAGHLMDMSETVTGKSERAPAQEATESDIPNQTQEKRRRKGNLRLAFVANTEVVTGYGQWWHPEMKSRLDTQARKDLSRSVVADGTGAVMSAWVAEERNRMRGQELTEEEEKLEKGSASEAKERELRARKQFNVSPLIKGGNQSQAIAETPWVLTWKVLGGRKPAKAQLMAKGYQTPDLRGGDMDHAGCGSRRSSHL